MKHWPIGDKRGSVAQDLTHTGAIPQRTGGVSKQALRLSLYVQLLACDIIAVGGGLLLTARVLHGAWLDLHSLKVGLLLLPTYLFFALNGRAYTINVLTSLGESLKRSMSAMLAASLLFLMFSYFMQSEERFSRLDLTLSIASGFALLAILRVCIDQFVVSTYQGRLVGELVVVDSVTYHGPSGMPVIDAKAANIQPDLQNPDMLQRLAQVLKGYDRLIVACPAERQQAWSLLMKGSNIRGEILMPPEETVGAIGLGKLGEAETLIVSKGPLSMRSRAQKRALDLLVTVPALIVLSPMMAVVAILVKMESAGPVFFRQPRVGRSNSIFYIMKFRSMRAADCDRNGARSTARDDDRITRVGAFIRKTSIDEIPQLINVLRGDMSLVGPRPHALGSLAGNRLFWQVDEQYWVRHALKPGITGLAQVRGFRGATAKEVDFENRLASDLEYVNTWSLWLDIKILFGTLRVVVHENAY